MKIKQNLKLKSLIITAKIFVNKFLKLHRLKAPAIAFSTHEIAPWANSRFGNPDNPSYIPNEFSVFSSRMSFWERLSNTWIVNFWKIFYERVHQVSMQKLVNEAFGSDVPPLSEIANTMSALFVNTHYSIFGARSYVPNVVEIGGIHIKHGKPLPKDIKNFLDDSSEGVLLFSWGSMTKASSLPKEKLDSIFKVIGNIPRKVIWKWEMDDILQKPKNLMIRK